MQKLEQLFDDIKNIAREILMVLDQVYYSRSFAFLINISFSYSKSS